MPLSHTLILMLLLTGLSCVSAAGTIRQVVPPQTINGCIAQMVGGDVCEVASGTYPELLASHRTEHTMPIPSGTPSAPTTIRAAPGATVWLIPTVRYPGGGGVVTVAAPAHDLHFSGLNVDAQHGHTVGLALGGANVTYTQAEVTGSRGQGVASQSGSGHVLSYLYVHHNGTGQSPTNVGGHHGMYVCGTDKLIEHNRVEWNATYGINVSCETGGIRNMIVRHNRVVEHPSRGIHISGSGHVVQDNVLVHNGIGIGMQGSQMVVERNTIDGYRPLPDNYGIIVQGSGLRLLDNHLREQVVRVFGTGGSRYIFWGDAPQPTMTGNTCDVAMPGCPVGAIPPPVVPPVVPVEHCTSTTTASATAKSYAVTTTITCP